MAVVLHLAEVLPKLIKVMKKMLLMEPRLTVAVLVEHDEKYLLAERQGDHFSGHWVVPGGGVDFGETLLDAAHREIKEETNLDVEIVKFIGFKEIINVAGNYHSIVFFYSAKPKHLDLKLDGESSQARFLSIEEIKKLKIAKSVEWVLREMGIWE